MLVDVDAIKRAQAYTESIVATVREPLLVLDASLRVRTASAAFYETYRVTPEDTIDRPLDKLGNGQWRIPALRELLKRVLSREGHVNDFEVEHEFEHIGTRTMHLNARQLMQATDQAPLILLAIEDITEERAMANQLRHNAAELSEADRHKNEFLAMLAHELRNPLAPLRNALGILRLKSGDPEVVQSASEMMERQVAHMVRLVDDLLDVSRISRGNIALRREPIDLASVVSHTVESVRAAFDSMDHELTVTLPSQAMYLNADPTRIAQVVGNLLNNACKFTDRGGRIGLTVERQGAQAVIRVRDSGIGLAADQLTHVFDIFVQVDTSLERRGSGLGLGLTLSAHLVEMHDGTIEVHSAGLGQGSEFVVRLPIANDPPKPLAPKPLAPTPAVSAPTIGTSRRILVVDDNRDAAESLGILLQLAGHETQLAYDGLEAVDVAATFQPDVILLDIGLPTLNGYDVARRIRAQPWGKNMMLLALTGWAQDDDRLKSKHAGFDGHLVKPVDPDALISLLGKVLRPS